MTTKSWTDEQIAIFDEFLKGEPAKHVVEDAKAGVGKTTTNVEGILQVAKVRPGTSVLAVAFNVKTKVELEKRLGASATTLTLNGMGHRAWGRAISKRLILEKDKVGTLVSDVVNAHDRNDAWGAVRELVSKAKTVGLVPSKAPKASGAMVEDTGEAWATLAAHFDVDFDDEIADMARIVLTQSILQGFDGVIDFDDQIYLPVVYGSGFERYDLVIGDEYQDLNPMNHTMIERSCKLQGRIFAVGDENQAIYAFRGADMDSMRKFKERKNAKELSLSICWRCAGDIIAHAQELVPGIKASPTARKGLVTSLDTWNETTFQAGDAILCRNNAPIIGLAFRLIRHGRGVHVVGRDLGANLKNLIKKLVGRAANPTIEFLLQELARWEHRETLNARARKDEDKERKVTDKAESLRAVIEFGQCKTITDINVRLDLLFSKESAPITLSTIHKSKGLEWNRVFALDSHLLNSDWLTQPWMIQADKNLDYVQRTRAMETLSYIQSTDWRKDNA